MLVWIYAFTHQEVSNKTDDQDDGEDEKSHAKGDSQDRCPEDQTKKRSFLKKVSVCCKANKTFLVTEAAFFKNLLRNIPNDYFWTVKN